MGFSGGDRPSGEVSPRRLKDYAECVECGCVMAEWNTTSLLLYRLIQTSASPRKSAPQSGQVKVSRALRCYCCFPSKRERLEGALEVFDPVHKGNAGVRSGPVWAGNAGGGR
jgi:hypothetical protein